MKPENFNYKIDKLLLDGFNSKSIYVKRRAKNRKIILDTIKSLGVKINYGKKEDTINSFLLSDLIKNIFVYDIPWKPLKNDELKILDNKYTIY